MAASTSMTNGGGQHSAAVWEWLNQGTWLPYSSEVCHHLEDALRTGKQTRVRLGDADPLLHTFYVDLPTWQQYHEHLKSRKWKVRRRLLPTTSAFTSGPVWQWWGDGRWNFYSVDIQCALDDAHSQGIQSVDLSLLQPVGLPYIIKISNLTQINPKTNFQRQVRHFSSRPYPKVCEAPTVLVLPCPIVNTTTPQDQDNSTQQGHIQQDNGPQAGPSHQATANSSDKPEKRRYNRRKLKATRMHAPQQVSSSSSSSPDTEDLSPTPGAAAAAGPSVIKRSSKKKGKSPKTMEAVVPIASVPSSSESSGDSSNHGSSKSVFKKFMDTVFGKQKHIFDFDDDEDVVVEEVPAGPTAEMDGISVIIAKYTNVVPNPPKDEDCCICCEELVCGSSYDQDPTVISLSQCNHMLHRTCLKQLYASGNKSGFVQCPTCKAIHGEKRGNQPTGKMKVCLIPQKCPGYPDCNTINIIYTFYRGIQGPDHPHPGRPYNSRGFPRFCYLPNNEKGQKVLALLKVAWQRRLLFTIGQSATTGEEDTVTWNEIHHKTELLSNHSGHGYPDPNYLDNVLLELAVQGVCDPASQTS